MVKERIDSVLPIFTSLYIYFHIALKSIKGER